MMSTKLPGFTAEDSLYASRQHYTMIVTRNVPTEAHIRLQLRRPPKDRCIPGCVCVSPIDCPCCGSLDWPWPFPRPDTNDESIP